MVPGMLMVVPHIGPKWNLEQYLESIGDEVEIPILIIDNSPGQDTNSMSLQPGIEVERHPENLGCAASWNRGAARGYYQTIICSVSTRFRYGFRHVVRGIQREATQWGCQWPGNEIAWHIRSFGRSMLNVNGLFDENYYPAYMEDCDYGRRYEALGWSPEIGVVSAHAAGIYTIGSGIAVQHGFGAADHGHGANEYYVRKWGGPPTQERFKTPFGDPDKHVSWWPPVQRCTGH